MLRFLDSLRIPGRTCLWLGQSGFFDQRMGTDEQGRAITRPPRWKLYLLFCGLEEKLMQDAVRKGMLQVVAPPRDSGKPRQ
jgi:hypothetical protein